MIPHEKALVERLKNEPFALLGVNTDTSKDDYRAKAKDMGVTWRSAWDGSTSGPVCRQWRVQSFPTVHVIDAKGVLRFTGLRGEPLSQAVDALLKEMKSGASGPPNAPNSPNSPNPPNSNGPAKPSSSEPREKAGEKPAGSTPR